MFCNQCGAKIPNDSRFCPACGAKAASGDHDAQNCSAAQSDRLTLPLLDKTVYFDTSIELYIALRKEFAKLGDDFSKEFLDSFHSKYSNMDTFVRDFPRDFSDIFKEAIDILNELLSEFQIFGITQDKLVSYLNKYCCRTDLELREIMEQYEIIVGQQEGMREYRQARKDSRGRLVGGGFGLTGAAKGIAKAGAVNMATGALHSVGNAIGNMGSAISASNAKNRLLGSGIDIYLAHAIKEDILNMHLVAVDIISARTGRNLCKFTAEEEQQANKIWEDLERRVISNSNKRAAVIRMLTIFPFRENYYRTAVKLFPSEIEGMRDFIGFFGYDIDALYNAMIERANPAVEILLEYQEEMEDLLCDDLDFPEDDIEPFTSDLTSILDYFSDIFTQAKETGFFFLPNEHDKGKSRLRGARAAYAAYGKEIPLLLYDSTLGKSGKTGFLVTDQHVYLKDTSKAVKLSLDNAILDIHQGENPSNHCTYLYFGDYGIHLLNSGDMVQRNIVDCFVEFIIALILFLTTVDPSAENLWEAIEQYQQLPQPQKSETAPHSQAQVNISPSHGSEVCFCFECGAENDIGDKFCCECGAELD